MYSDDDLAALLAAAETLSTPLRTATYRTLLGLRSVTGMRIGEAIRLDRADIDTRSGLLVVRSTKFGKDRQIPLHPTTMHALTGYLSCRGSSRMPPQRRCSSPPPGPGCATATSTGRSSS